MNLWEGVEGRRTVERTKGKYKNRGEGLKGKDTFTLYREFDIRIDLIV